MKALKANRQSRGFVETILHARVPIIKFIDTCNGEASPASWHSRRMHMQVTGGPVTAYGTGKPCWQFEAFGSAPETHISNTHQDNGAVVKVNMCKDVSLLCAKSDQAMLRGSMACLECVRPPLSRARRPLPSWTMQLAGCRGGVRHKRVQSGGHVQVQGAAHAVLPRRPCRCPGACASPPPPPPPLCMMFPDCCPESPADLWSLARPYASGGVSVRHGW